MPGEQALPLRQRADHVGREKPLLGDGAQVDEGEIAALPRRLGSGCVDEMGEQRAAPVEAEQNRVPGGAEIRGLVGR